MVTNEAEAASEMEETIIDLGNEEHSWQGRFTGRWIIGEGEEMRTSLDGWDAGICWEVALTEQGNILVYTTHINGRVPPSRRVYGSIEEAEGEVPGDILSMVAADLGEEYAADLDI